MPQANDSDQPVASESREPQRVVTVRMPRSLHERLLIAGGRQEGEAKPSMNRFCVRALEAAVERMQSA